jgi:hypothetical protein
VPTAADFNALFSDPVEALVITSQTTTSTGYTDLATVGPQVSLTMVAGQKASVHISARIKHSAAGGQSALMSWAVTGATSVAASDNWAIESADTTTGGITLSRSGMFTAGNTGSHTVTAKYQVQAGGTGTYFNRYIQVKKN